jgi:hypothetical protein
VGGKGCSGEGWAEGAGVFSSVSGCWCIMRIAGSCCAGAAHSQDTRATQQPANILPAIKCPMHCQCWLGVHCAGCCQAGGVPSLAAAHLAQDIVAHQLRLLIVFRRVRYCHGVGGAVGGS